ncbi:hypothetical protein EJ07DRAFT_177115 [Lizonia empirigonia]|nr:hypothetical protein EJ07DRAFT_177115 [Lizonia empirigonia]
MAPARPSPKLKEPDQTHGARVQKPKRKTGPVRRLENGLLDVTRKSGKHVKTIKQNSLTPLLQLPPEVRNQIWEYALGGNVFEITSSRKVQTRRRTKESVQPKHAFPLLGVCRQIYAETALLPYKANAFDFKWNNPYDWVHGLHKVQSELISEVHMAEESGDQGPWIN